MKKTVQKPILSSNLFLFLVILLFSLAACETVLHVLYPSKKKPAKPAGWVIIPEQSWVEYHPALGWAHQKNKSSQLDKNQLSIPLTTNSLGLRGPWEYFKAKPAEKIRAYAIGDSFTFGFGVRDEEVFTRVMETIDSGTEVMNMGVAGYGVDQIYLSLKEFGFSYRPDVVFILIYPEDFWRATRAFNDAGFGKPYFFLESDGRLTKKHVPVPKEKNFEVPQFPVFQEASKFDEIFAWSRIYTLGQKAWVSLKKRAGKEDPESGPEWKLGRKILSETVNLIRANNAKPVLVVVPPRRWITGSVEPIGQSMINFAKREGIAAIDLTGAFKEAVAKSSVDEYYIPDDYHWTARGHRLVAEILLKQLDASHAK